MLFDLRHHAVLQKTLTDGFEASLKQNIIPALERRFASALTGVQMYEDYLADDFTEDGYRYYPLTAVLRDTYRTVWIRWRHSPDGENFRDGNPYAYVGDGTLPMEIAEDVPTRFSDAIAYRSRFFDVKKYLPITVECEEENPLALLGKYSQTFVDEMAKSVTRLLEETGNVRGICDSGIGLKLVFSPITYMEHTSGSVTYRRLLLTDSVRTVRDLWVSWERVDGDGAFSVRDNPIPSAIAFHIGMPVPLSVREREYRYLVRSDPDAFEKAMATRNLTAFHTVLHRASVRGDLTEIAPPAPIKQQTPEPTPAPAPVAETSPTAEDDPLLLALAKAAGVSLPKTEEKTPEKDPWADLLGCLERGVQTSDWSPEEEEAPSEVSDDLSEQTPPTPPPAPVDVPVPAEVPAPAETPAPVPQPIPTEKPKRADNPSPTQIYTLHLTFRFAPDPNVCVYIQRILEETLAREGKEHLDFAVRSFETGRESMDLIFSKYPANERELLITMIKAIGNGNLGVCKIAVDEN